MRQRGGAGLQGGGGACVWYQDVQTCRFEEGDLVSDGERGEAWKPLGKLHNLYNALSGELTELVPQAQVQLHPVVSAGVLGERRHTGVCVCAP